MEFGPGDQPPTRQKSALLNRPLSDNGLPSGSINVIGDGSVTSVDYWVEALAGECLLVGRFINYIAASSQQLVVGGYGDLPVLTNGIQIFLYRAALDLTFDITDGLPIKSHEHWARWNFDAVPIGPYGVGGKSPFFVARWTFTKFGTPWGLVLNVGDKVGLRIRDNLSGLLEQSAIAQGVHLAAPNPAWTLLL